MSDAFIYFWIIGAGLSLGVLSVSLPVALYIFKKRNKTKKRER